MYQTGIRILMRGGNFEGGKGAARCKVYGLCVMSCAEMAEPMLFGMWTDSVGPRKHVLDGMHIGATWRMRLNRPCAAAMRPFC